MNRYLRLTRGCRSAAQSRWRLTTIQRNRANDNSQKIDYPLCKTLFNCTWNFKKLKLEMVMDIEQRINEIFEGIKIKKFMPIAVFQGMRGIIRDAESERDALNDQLETTKRELMATTISWENALAELQKALESATVPAMPMHAFALSDEDIENAMHGKDLPMDYDELKQYAREIERAILAKAMPIPKQEPLAEPLIYIRKSTREWIDTVKPFMSARFEMQFRTDDALEEYCIPLYAEPQPAQAAAIPEGWKLVPIRPTDAMLDAAAEKLYGHPRQKAIEWVKEEKFDSYADDANDAYCAMLSASPKP